MNKYLGESLDEVLRELLESDPKITGVFLISREGLAISSKLRADTQMNYIAAIGAALLSLGNRVCDEFSKDKIECVVVLGEHGKVITLPVGEKALLLMDTTREWDFDIEFDFDRFCSRLNSAFSSSSRVAP